MHIDLHRLSPGQGDSILDDAHLIGQPGLAVVGELLLVIVLQLACLSESVATAGVALACQSDVVRPGTG